MKFLLFSKISFEIINPIDLIECYCCQSDFYANYDLLLKGRYRIVEDVNKIGARIKNEALQECKREVTDKTRDMPIFQYDLDEFLELDDETRHNHVRELNEKVIKKLLKIKGIGLSKVTKVLHTLYPKIIPMVDNPLQEEYRKEINLQWTEERSDQILIDYYKNLTEDYNQENLNEIFNDIKRNFVVLTKVRIFDILWWSYLKAKDLNSRENINWTMIKW